jgi:hypothetical protein
MTLMNLDLAMHPLGDQTLFRIKKSDRAFIAGSFKG